jgi:hypothetical protein
VSIRPFPDCQSLRPTQLFGEEIWPIRGQLRLRIGFAGQGSGGVEIHFSESSDGIHVNESKPSASGSGRGKGKVQDIYRRLVEDVEVCFIISVKEHVARLHLMIAAIAGLAVSAADHDGDVATSMPMASQPAVAASLAPEGDTMFTHHLHFFLAKRWSGPAATDWRARRAPSALANG